MIRKAKKRDRNYLKKNFKFFLSVKKKVVLLHPLRETLKQELKGVKKREEYVPRHIELTAVLREILRQKNKSNRIE
ncbi:hypothetical protein, partial [Flavobacterium sp. W20_MBD1_R3]|uniref:hypothetical protein n=1 Tax=Flavobacterium sp. W20_MBD1_R3 TaxID=3240278 RepID=UPI003F91F9CD